MAVGQIPGRGVVLRVQGAMQLHNRPRGRGRGTHRVAQLQGALLHVEGVAALDGVARDDDGQGVQAHKHPEELVEGGGDDVQVHERGDERLVAAVGGVVQELRVLQGVRR